MAFDSARTRSAGLLTLYGNPRISRAVIGVLSVTAIYRQFTAIVNEKRANNAEFDVVLM
jgi:hypothetical protein